MIGHLIVAVVAFGIMVFVHELGHFLVAKRMGITVHAFALGFGPRLAGFQRGGTTYAINLVPFGGYVRLAGEDLDDTGGPDTFRAKSVWQRMAVLGAGPLMNITLALLLYAGLALVLGVLIGATNRIDQLMTTCVDDRREVPCPAAQAGLQAGDAIVAINGRAMATGEEVIDTIHRNPHTQLRLTVERGGRRFEVEVRSVRDARTNLGLIWYRPEAMRERVGPIGALQVGASTVAQIGGLVLAALGSLVTRPRQAFGLVAGPIGAALFLGETARAGGDLFLSAAANFSVIIGLFNLLPFPALDGGRLLFVAVEAVRRRPIDPRREGYIHMVGFALLILLLVTLSVRDVFQLFSF